MGRMDGIEGGGEKLRGGRSRFSCANNGLPWIAGGRYLEGGCEGQRCRVQAGPAATHPRSPLRIISLSREQELTLASCSATSPRAACSARALSLPAAVCLCSLAGTSSSLASASKSTLT